MPGKTPTLLPAVFVLCAAEFLQAGMVAFAATPIMGEIGAAPEEFSLIASLYACVAVISIAKQHWLIERLGWRGYLSGSAALFVAGALLCAQSEGVLHFALGRIAMALGGGPLMATARLLVMIQPPGRARFTGIKVFATGLGSGMALAPVMAAMAISSADRALIFYFLCVVMLVGTGLAMMCVPAHVKPEEFSSQSGIGRLFILALASFSFLYFLQRSYYDFYSDYIFTIVMIAVALLGLYAFLHIEHGHKTPLIRVREVISRRYILGMSLFGIAYLMLGANNYVIPIFMQRGLSYTWETTGMFQSFGLASSVVTWGVMFTILPRSPGLRKYLVCGLLCLIFFSISMTNMSPDADPYTALLPGLLLYGCFIILTLATAAMQTFYEMQDKDHLFIHGYQLKAMLAQMATAFGTSIATLILQWRSTVQYDRITMRIYEGSPIYLKHLDDLVSLLTTRGAGASAKPMALVMMGRDILQQVTLLASLEYFKIIALVGAGGIFILLVHQSQLTYRRWRALPKNG